MRIISGIHKGRKLHPPSNLPIRPTKDMAKESLFNILQNRYYFKNKEVLDLFAGSGNISYEFGSRGCYKITAVDKNKNCIAYIREQKKNLQLNINPIQSDAINYIKKTTSKFDFIFIDPPYNYENYNKIKELIIEKNIIKENGCLIIEHDKQTKFTEENLELKKYGSVCFSIFSF